MASLTLIALLAAIVYAILNLNRIKAWIRKRQHIYECMAPIQGPSALPLIGCVHHFKLNMMEFAKQMWAYGFEYGDKQGLMAIWLGSSPAVALFRAKHAEQLFTSNTEINKSNNYDVLLPWLGDGLLLKRIKNWRERRRQLTPTFHFSILEQFMNVYNEQAFVLTEIFKETKGEQFDLFPYMKRCTLDVICATSMGTKMQAQTNHDSDYVMSVHHLGQLAFKFQRSPWLWPNFMWYLTGNGYQFDKCINTLETYNRRTISQRLAMLTEEAELQGLSVAQMKHEKKVAFLDLLLSMYDAGQLTMEDVEDEVKTFMFAGHDTVSCCTSWTLWFLSHYPEYQEKAFEEINQVMGGETDHEITVDDLKDLRYLEMCIKEALRLCPPVPCYGREVNNDIVCGDITIAAGVTALVYPAMIQRDPDEYERPIEYYPDHFLPEKCATRNPFAFVPFSAGPRNCIGQKFAWYEMKTVLSHVLMEWKVVPCDTLENVLPLPETVMSPPNGFPVKLIPRDAESRAQRLNMG